MRTLTLVALLTGCASAPLPALSPVAETNAPLEAPRSAANATPEPIDGPEVWKLPDGCVINQRGLWRNGDGRRFEATDDGKVLRLSPLPGDGGRGGAELIRSGTGFQGVVFSEMATASGRTCPVRFHAEVSRCWANGLTLEVERAFLVDERCRRLPDSGERDRIQLWRIESGRVESGE